MEQEEFKAMILTLQKTAENLDNLELTLLDRLDNEEPEAHEILNKGIEDAEKIYYSIGKQLNNLGGFELMQFALNQVSNKYSAHTVINYSWNNIGLWQS